MSGLILLENKRLKLALDPDRAKITSLYDKRGGREWLWTAGQRMPKDDSFDENWNGGIDLLFPCDEPWKQQGEAYPDHGICWTEGWSTLRHAGNQEVLLGLRQNGLALEYMVSLLSDEICLHFSAKNCMGRPFPFLFRFHPAIPFEPDMRLFLPGEEHSDANRSMDAKESTGTRNFILAEGRAVVVDAENRKLQMEFDRESLPCLSIFFSRGGFMGYEVLVPEPATAAGCSAEVLASKGLLRTLEPGQRESFTLRLSPMAAIDTLCTTLKEGDGK